MCRILDNQQKHKIHKTHTTMTTVYFNLETTGPKIWVCEILCRYMQWCDKSIMYKNNDRKINIIQIQYIKV